MSGEAGLSLNQSQLSEFLSGCLVGSALVCLDTIDSTNTECRRRAETGAPEGLVVTAEEQTGGRGRRGRSFHSPRGRGLYLSALLRPAVSPDQLNDFTAWTAVATCDGIEAACGLRPRIKWTNDLVLGGKKLCGILTELGLSPGSSAPDYLVTGIGVNVNHRPGDFPAEVGEIATSLALELGRPVDRQELAGQIVLALDRAYAGFPHRRPDYLARYRADCLTPGNQVQLITPTARQQAFAVEIDDQFRLVVELPDGTRRALSAGEVSVRGMYGYL